MKIKKLDFKKIFWWSVATLLLGVSSFSLVYADGECTDEGDGGCLVRLENPLQTVDNIPDFVRKLLDIVITIGTPIIALAIIYSGFLFVSAQGNPEKLKKARSAFTFTLIGAAILLAAVALAEAIGGTVEAL